MKHRLILFLLATTAFAATPVDSEVQRVQALITTHRSSLTRLNSAAAASAQNLISGGTYYICCTDDALNSEAYGRAGGSMGVAVYAGQQLTTKDVVWVNYSPSTYQSIAALVAQMNVPQGAVVVWLGPRPPTGPPGTYWIDSLTSWADDETFTLMGNVLSFWSLTGELAAATARQGRTLVFWESIEPPGAAVRNGHYTNQLFHTGWPQMAATIQAGTLAGSYLDYVGTMVGQIVQAELSKIVATGQLMALRKTAGTPVVLAVNSHLVRILATSGNQYFQYFDLNGSTQLSTLLLSNGYLVALDYFGVNLETWRTVRNTAGANATWINAVTSHQADFNSYGDTMITQHWDFGDSAVPVPGYDVALLPASGVAQLFIYDLLLRAAENTAGSPPPSVTITTPASNTTVSNGSVFVSATASAATGLTIATVQLKVDGSNFGTSCTASPCNATLSTAALTNGAHSITATATDSAGTMANSQAVSITVNNAAPSVAITAPVAGTTVTTGSVQVTASASVGSGLTLASIQLKVDGTNFGTACTVSPCSAALNTTSLTNGAHSLTAVAIDSASNSTTSAAVSITVTNGPTVSITAPATGTTVTTGSVQVTAAASVPSGLTLASIQLKVDGANFGTACTVSPCSATLSTTSLTNGAHNLTAVAIDSSSNSTTSAAVSITVTNGPTVSITAPATGTTVTTGSVQVTAAASAPTGQTLASIQLKVDGTNFGTACTVSPCSATLNTTSLTNGAHSLTAVATDSSSNSTTSTAVSITVTNGPTVSITSPATGTTVTTGSVQVTAAASAPSGLTLASIQLKVDGTNFGTACTVSPCSATLNTTSLTNGAHSLTAVAIDSASNSTTSAAVSITVTNGPTVSITAPAAGSTVTTGSVQVTATASAPSGLTLASIQLKVDGANFGTACTVSPCSATLSTTSLTNGTHSLTAVATDSGSNATTSAAVSITVTNGPTVSITAPATGTTVTTGSVQVTAAASAPTGQTIASIQLKVDGTNFGTACTVSPCSAALNTTSLTNGTHNLTAVAIDSASNSTTSAAVSITVTNGPTVSITAPAAGTTVTTGSVQVTAAASAPSGLTLASIQLKVDGANFGTACTVSPCSATLSTTSLTNGAHNLTAVATDSSSNSTTSAAVSITVTNGPTVSITAPATGTTVTTGSVQVTAAASAPTGQTLASIQLKVDGTNFGTACTVSPCSATLNTTSLTNGAHSLTAVATDSSSNSTTSAAVSITVTSGPTVSITAPAAGTTVTIGSVQVTVAASAPTGQTIASIQLKVDGTNFGTACTVSPCSATLNTTSLTNGAHNLTAVATDSASNSTTSTAVSITVTNGPTVSITAPAAGTTVTTGSVQVTATASAPSGLTLASIQLKVDGTNFGTACTVSPCTATLSTTSLTNGTHSLTALAIDSASNSTTSAAVSITVTNGPTVSITAPATGTTVTTGSVQVTAAASAPAGQTIASIQLKVDGTNFGTACTVSPCSATLNTTSLTNGAHSLTTVATDSSSNSTISTAVSITVTNGPTVSITAPAAGSTVTTGSVQVTATASAPSGLTLASIQLKVDGANFGTACTVSPCSATLNTTSLTNGTHSLTAVATDSSSNSTTSAAVNITVTNGPAVAITAPATGTTVTTGSLQVTAAASAPTGQTIASIQLKVDGTNFGSACTTSPCSATLNTASLTNGTHSLTATVIDSAAISTTSAAVSITVTNPAPSVPLITSFTNGTLRNNFGSFVGMQFTVGSTGLTVTSLGRIFVAGNTGSHLLKLVRVSDGTDVPGASVTVTPSTGTAGQFTYALLPNPITLAAGTSYYLVSQEALNGDRWYDYTPVTATSVVSVNGPVYWNGAGWSPVGFAGFSYVPVSLLYTTAASTAPPTVSVTAPAPNSIVSGSSVTVTASATAASGLTIANIQLKVDGTSFGAACVTSPCNATLDTTALSNGPHSLTAVATDSVNSSATSTAVTVTVSNNVAPPPNGNPLITAQTLASPRNNFTGFVGMRFQVGSSPMTVGSLGRICINGNAGTHTVKLVKADGTDLVNGTVSVSMAGCVPGQYTYQTLTTGITLSANTAYYLVSQELAGGDQWYDYGPVTPTSAATISGPVYLAGSYFLVSSPGYSYVPVNLLYQ